MTTSRRFKFLTPEDVRALSTFEFAPRALVEGYMAGRHKSHSRGPSIEFRDYRQFVPGDDPALIDWRVFARTDRHYLRTFEQETHLECHVFLDGSASMGFGRRITKLEFASFFCAALCYLVVRNNDRVSLQIFDGAVRAFFPPGSTQSHLYEILNALERNRPGRDTSLAEALQRSHRLLKRRGVLIVISDFFDDAAAIFTALNPYLHRGFRVHLFHVLDPEDVNLPDRGLVTFRDLEDGARVIAHTEDIRRGYRDAMQDHIENLRSLAARRGVDYALCRSDEHYFRLFNRLTR